MTATTAAIALLATAAVGVAPAMAQPPVPAATTAVVAENPEDKFTDKAHALLTKQRQADFWVKLADKADLSEAEKIADWDQRGQYVYDTLRKVANESQADLIKKLDVAGADYEPFWIDNRILVEDGTLALATELAASPEVKEIRQTSTLELVEPVETKPSGDRGLHAVEWGVEAINAPDAWAMGVTGQGITVSSIDTGAQFNHPALASHYRGAQADGSVVHDYNWFDSSAECDGAPCDPHGHGSHVTGTMTGDDGGSNQIGVAPGAEWVSTNGCWTCSDADLLESGQWIIAPTRVDGSDPDVTQRPHIVNNSWGATAAGAIDDWYTPTTEAWKAAGIFASWSAGNSGSGCQTTSSPGANTGSYSTGAFDSAGNIASFSSRGPGQAGEIKPNISAPGVNVRSAMPGSTYGLMSGTSMASPHLGGAVALLWSYAPSLVGDIDATWALLDETATDVDNTSCGGTADDNNVWGEGKLDVAALLAAAPSEGVGTLAGTVTDAGGAPIAGATVSADGDEQDRSVTTGEDGTYSVVLTEGDYDVSASAYGFLTETTTATIAPDETTTLDMSLEAAPSHVVSGTVTSGGTPVGGATVTIAEALEPVTTGADGTFSFPAVPAGTYELGVAAGACYAPYTEEVVVDGDESVPVALELSSDAFGYTCSVSEGAYLQGTTKVPLTGDDSSTSVALPFEFPFYDETYGTAYATTNGFVNFLGASSTWTNTSIPNAAAPNAAIYPFWDDLQMDASSGLYTASTTIGGQEAFTIEWRDIFPRGASSSRFSFSATLLADGTIITGYGPGAADDRRKGSSATVGIENPTGTIGYQYGFNTAVTHEGMTVTYDAPPMGTLEGLVRDYNTKEPVEDATVTATDVEDGSEWVATTGADGRYEITMTLGRYDITIEADGYETAVRTANFTEDGQVLTRSAQLNAGRLVVTKESITASLAMGGSATRAFQVSNTGSAPVEVEIGAGDASFVPLGSTTAGSGVIKGVDGEATVAESTVPAKASLGSSFGSGEDKPSLSTSGAKAGASIMPEAVPLAGQVITHSASQTITPANSASCNNQVVTQDNRYLRTFTLSDFGITGSFDVSEVQFGIETTDSAQPLTVNLYSLDGDLVYANMTLLGSAEATVAAGADGTIVTVPVEGSVPAGGTLVVEVEVPAGGWFFIGSNGEGQTAPSYISSDACSIPEPTDTAEIGFADMHLVMNVAGNTSGSGVEWLDVQPGTITLQPGASARVVATMTANVDQPGTYGASIQLGANTPYDAPSVSATMNVSRPAGWGKITGTVTGGGEPLEGAVVHLDGVAYDVTLFTDADGTYEYWMAASNGPVQATVAATGYLPQTKKAQIVNGQTTVYNFNLTPLP